MVASEANVDRKQGFDGQKSCTVTGILLGDQIQQYCITDQLSRLLNNNGRVAYPVPSTGEGIFALIWLCWNAVGKLVTWKDGLTLRRKSRRYVTSFGVNDLLKIKIPENGRRKLDCVFSVSCRYLDDS